MPGRAGHRRLGTKTRRGLQASVCCCSSAPTPGPVCPTHPAYRLVPPQLRRERPLTAQPVPSVLRGLAVSHPHHCWLPRAVFSPLPASLQPGGAPWAGTVFHASPCPALTGGPWQRTEGGRRVMLCSRRLPGPRRSTSSGCAGRVLVSTCWWTLWPLGRGVGAQRLCEAVTLLAAPRSPSVLLPPPCLMPRNQPQGIWAAVSLQSRGPRRADARLAFSQQGLHRFT